MKSSYPTKVLIVEDEAVLALDLEDGLLRQGFDICARTVNRRDAIVAAEKHRPDVAIMDVRLSGGDDGVQLGTDFARRYGTIVLYATANAEEVRRRGDAGLLAIVEKPYSIDGIVQGIRTAQQLALPAF